MSIPATTPEITATTSLREPIVKTVRWGSQTIQDATRGFFRSIGSWITKICETVRPFFSKIGNAVSTVCRNSVSYISTHRVFFGLAAVAIFFGCIAWDSIKASGRKQPGTEENIPYTGSKV